jgi:hypothetical protein
MNGSSVFGWPVEVRLADHDFQESSSADGGSKADQEPPPSANIYCKVRSCQA